GNGGIAAATSTPDWSSPIRSGTRAMSFVLPSLAAAFLGAIVLTWLVRKVAHRLCIVDRPEGVRKLHRSPLPLTGGGAVCGAWILGSCVGSIFNPESNAGLALSVVPEGSLSITGGFGPSLLLAAGVVLVMGVVDDAVGLRPRWKLLGQTIAASILV